MSDWIRARKKPKLMMHAVPLPQCVCKLCCSTNHLPHVCQRCDRESCDDMKLLLFLNKLHEIESSIKDIRGVLQIMQPITAYQRMRIFKN